VCTNPKNSFGIIAYKKIDKSYKYLLICRRNTIGFVQFLRGKYILSDSSYIQKLFNVMTNNEIELIQTNNFKFLWEFLWLDKFYSTKSDTRKDYNSAETKFNQIKQGKLNGNTLYTIDYFIKNKSEFYYEPEWGFPKGRRNMKDYNEKNVAIREFKEETNINQEYLEFYEKPSKFVEEYRSYDNINYKNTYFIAKYIGEEIKFNIDIKNKEQFTEVSDIKFFSLEECREKIRKYSKSKVDILTQLDILLN
tara:strand:+ start:595 stop:1344 length:750 start_codon:yes stop_codon:yes gene_type:complete